MNLKIPKIQTDNRSAVIARDFSIFDAPIRREKKINFDDYKGVIDESKEKGIIDDSKNPYDHTLPILVKVIKQISRDKLI